MTQEFRKTKVDMLSMTSFGHPYEYAALTIDSCSNASSESRDVNRGIFEFVIVKQYFYSLLLLTSTAF